MDREITYINCMTGNHPSGAHIPLYFDTDRICIEKALETVGLVEPENAKVLRIHNTLELGELLVSETFRSEVETARGTWKSSPKPEEMAFDDNGDLPLAF